MEIIWTSKYETDIILEIFHCDNDLHKHISNKQYLQFGDKITIGKGLKLAFQFFTRGFDTGYTITDSFILEGKIIPEITSNVLADWLATTFAEKKIIGIKIEDHIIGKDHSVGSSSFSMTEFKDNKSLTDFIGTIKKDINIEINDINALNNLVKNPNFFDIWRKNIEKSIVHKIIESHSVRDLIKRTENMKNKSFSELSKDEKRRLLHLNRLLISRTYPGKYPSNINVDRDKLYEMMEKAIQEKYQLLKSKRNQGEG